MPVRRALASLAAAVLIAVGLQASPAAAPPAAAASCADASNLTLLSSGTYQYASGQYYFGLDLYPGQIMNSQVRIYTCGGTIPAIGERFYVMVASQTMQPAGEAPQATHALRLPAGLYPAVDGSNPLRCWVGNGSPETQSFSADVCPGGVFLDSAVGGFPWTGGTAVGLGLSRIATGQYFVSLLPVVATKPFAGLGSPDSDALYGGAYVQAIGVPSSYHLYPKLPFYVNDRAPVVGYPASPVTGIGNTGATLQAQITNFWKAGTAWMEYGATTGYGQVTPAESIPGNDPAYPAYLTDPHVVTGLVPGTTYHWRAVFRTSSGALYYGADRTFTTTGTKPSDSTPPAVSTSSPTGAFSKSTALRFAYSATDSGSGVASYSVRWARATAGGGALSAWTYPASATATTAKSFALTGTPGYRYCFSVTARDAVGNVSAWSAPRCTVVPFDDRSLTASSGWTRGTASGWISGTFTSGSRNGATLTRSTSTGVRQVGVIATTCATCGSVAVYIGSTKVGTISLVSSTTVSRALKTLPRFTSKRTGTVRLVVTSSTGKLVKIDALATTDW